MLPSGKLENENMDMEKDVYPFIEDMKRRWRDKQRILQMDKTRINDEAVNQDMVKRQLLIQRDALIEERKEQEKNQFRNEKNEIIRKDYEQT